ncbi:MAG: hypothetical protein M3R17_12880 [Bacteroidota bacterium]|nr:hypothetical protein [Bacteroidota bacterium]
MKLNLMIFSLIITFLAGCVRERHEKELAEINSLRTELLKTDSLLSKTDLEFAERMAAEVKNNTQFIQFNLKKLGDTVDFKTYKLLNNYGSLLPAFEKVAENHKHLSAAIDSTSKSLNDLAHDFEKNSLAKNLTPESCIQQERDQVSGMYEFAGTMRSSLGRAKAGYDTLAPKIADYMKSLNQKLADKQENLSMN